MVAPTDTGFSESKKCSCKNKMLLQVQDVNEKSISAGK